MFGTSFLVVSLCVSSTDALEALPTIVGDASVAIAAESPDVVSTWSQRLLPLGVQVVDTNAIRQQVDEAALATGDEREVWGALGAAFVLRADTEQHARLVRIQTGEVVWEANMDGTASKAPTIESNSLEAELRRLADRVAAGLDKLPGTLRYQRFAVLPFKEDGAQTVERRMGTLVSAELVTRLRRDHNLMLVERAAIDKVIGELGFGQTGLVAEESAAEAGRLLGAQALVMGTVSQVGGTFKAHVRVVEVASGKIALADAATLPAAGLISLSDEAVVLRSRAGAVYRSLLLPGWGQLYNREPTKSAAFVIAEVGAGVGALVFHFMGNGKQNEYNQLGANASAEQFAQLEADAESRFQTRNWLLIAVGVIHALNIADAYFSGKTFDQAVASPAGAGFTF